MRITRNNVILPIFRLNRDNTPLLRACRYVRYAVIETCDMTCATCTCDMRNMYMRLMREAIPKAKKLFLGAWLPSQSILPSLEGGDKGGGVSVVL